MIKLLAIPVLLLSLSNYGVAAEKCDRNGKIVSPAGKAPVNVQDTCCGGKGPRIGMNMSAVQLSCWGKPYGVRRMATAQGSVEVHTYFVQTTNGRTKTLYFVNGVLTVIEEGL
jgi:hypothetical protein